MKSRIRILYRYTMFGCKESGRKEGKKQDGKFLGSSTFLCLVVTQREGKDQTFVGPIWNILSALFLKESTRRDHFLVKCSKHPLNGVHDMQIIDETIIISSVPLCFCLYSISFLLFLSNKFLLLNFYVIKKTSYFPFTFNPFSFL
jgi:hypothetical protein